MFPCLNSIIITIPLLVCKKVNFDKSTILHFFKYIKEIPNHDLNLTFYTAGSFAILNYYYQVFSSNNTNIVCISTFYSPNWININNINGVTITMVRRHELIKHDTDVKKVLRTLTPNCSGTVTLKLKVKNIIINPFIYLVDTYYRNAKKLIIQNGHLRVDFKQPPDICNLQELILKKVHIPKYSTSKLPKNLKIELESCTGDGIDVFYEESH